MMTEHAHAAGDTIDRHVGSPAFKVRLVCWHCGASRDVLTPAPPQFAYEVIGLAGVAGMKGFFDLARGRVLVFCNGDHARQQMTKDGRFRLRPKSAGTKC
mgnify:CR=1 FL=1